MQRKKTTSEVVPELGIGHKALITYLYRHPEYRPPERLPNGDYLWSDEDIQRVAEARERRQPITT